ncbi:hypothetical protein ABK040_005663 [Willaertia magna]
MFKFPKKIKFTLIASLTTTAAVATTLAIGSSYYKNNYHNFYNEHFTIFAETNNNNQQIITNVSLDQKNDNFLSKEQKEQLNHLFETYQIILGSPGLQISIAKNGQLIYNNELGYANLESLTKMSPFTKFRIGSISKSITGVAVALLVERGLLDLDKSIYEYLSTEKFPYLKFKGQEMKDITVRQLAMHLSGIRHYKDDTKEFLNWNEKYLGDNLKKSCDLFIKDDLEHEPGEKFSYTTYGYTLLSAVIDEVIKSVNSSGNNNQQQQSYQSQDNNNALTLHENKLWLKDISTFRQFCQKRIFKPLQMSDTVWDEKHKIILHRAGFYQRDNTKNGNCELINVPQVDNSYKWAGGGLLSTSLDLVKFGTNLSNLFHYTNTLEQILWKDHYTKDNIPTEYALGFVVKELTINGGGNNNQKVKVVYHTGGSVGSCSVLYLIPSKRLVIGMNVNILSAKYLVDTCEQVVKIIESP